MRDVLTKLYKTMIKRTAATLATLKSRLIRETALRKAAQASLKKSEQHHLLLQKQSSQLQEQLRYLSHHVLLESEEQRRQISRELHDEIAQVLAGINVHLASLQVEATFNTKGLSKKIASTQRLVEKSVKIVHQFAQRLRPACLDDLGIIPSLKNYMNDFAKRTGTLIKFTAFTKVDELNSAKRTVLYRVAQAALANITQHADATQVNVTIRKLQNAVRMEIHDNGKSFDVERVLSSKMNERLGLIGMRERVEMVGGSFSIDSSPKRGTTIYADIPAQKKSGSRRKSPHNSLSLP